MAGGYSIVVAGTVITASRENQYVSRQVITRFANTSARDSAISDAEEGMYADLADCDALTRYSGSAWGIAGHPRLVARLTSDATGIISNTSLADVAGLAVTAPVNHTYLLDADILYTAAGGNSAGQFKLGWTAPSGASLTWSNVGLVVHETTGVAASATFDVSTLSDARSYGAANASTCHVKIWGVYTVAGNAGALQMQAAQVASSATATVVKAASRIELRMIA